MAFDPSTLIAGPAVIIWKGQTIFSEGDVTVNFTKDVKEKKISLYGIVAQKFLASKATISFKPAGLYAALYPYTSIAYGARIYGNDTPLTIHSVDGKKYTFARAAITKMPSMPLGVEKDIISDVEFTALKSVSKEWDDADALYTIAAEALTLPPVNTAIFRDGPFTITYDSQAVYCEEGVDVNLNMTTTEVKVDTEGECDARVSGLEMTASFKPVSWADDTYKTNLGVTAVKRGALITGKKIVVSDPEGTIITLYGMVPRQGGLHFDAAISRQENMEFTGTRNLIGGIPGNWFDIGFTDAAPGGGEGG